MLINILTISLGIALGYILKLVIDLIIKGFKTLRYRGSRYKVTQFFTHDNKRYEKTTKEAKKQK